MSDDEADPELLDLLRKSLGLGPPDASAPPDTGVLKSAQFVADNAIDISIRSQPTKDAAEKVWKAMQLKEYSTKTWSEHNLHPKAKDEATLNFIFTMDLLNFCFWSELSEEQRFGIDYQGQKWTGYWALVAAIRRALEEGIPFTSPSYWLEATDEELSHIFRSATDEPMPLLSERIRVLRETADILDLKFDGRPVNIIEQANKSAAGLVNILVEVFPAFRDERQFHGKTVRFHKRAQILAADIWACFDGESYGDFDDISHLTVFADYRVPQVLQSLNILWYSPRVESKIKRKEEIAAGDNIEIELRGCTIWAAELLRNEIIKQHPEAKERINAVLLDFFLYDTAKEEEKRAIENPEDQPLPHHHTRSIWY